MCAFTSMSSAASSSAFQSSVDFESFSSSLGFVQNNNDFAIRNLGCLNLSFASIPECQYIREGIRLGVRTDGRKLKNYRFGRISDSIISFANGSASYENFENYVLCVVKLDLVSTNGEELEEDNIHISIDCPSSTENLRFMGNSGEDAAFHLSNFLKKFCFSSTFFDKMFLCILQNYFYWNVYIDIVILRLGGNLIDAITIAILAALQNTIIPKVMAYKEIDVEEDQKVYQIEVDDNCNAGNSFPCDSIPICITVGEINRCYVWDLSAKEECCVDSLICVFINSNNECVGSYKSGGGSIELSALRSVLLESEKIGKAVLQQLKIKK